jgi:monoamine oxidase
MTRLSRREWLGAAMGAAALPLAGCDAPGGGDIAGGFAGTHLERGHVLRDPGARDRLLLGPAPVARHAQVVIAGGGIAGLAAARALRLNGIDDVALLELEDTAGGNSRGGQVDGIACPLGAHYLPVPGDDAHEVQDWLEEIGVRRRLAGRWRYDERYLCHSPQERHWRDGAWHEGLLPVDGVAAATLAQYRRFAALIDGERRTSRHAMPALRAPFDAHQRQLARNSFAAWLDAHGLTDEHLRWYLDYCCRDDYGAGPSQVSAWAGVHYFASRHGFSAPGDDSVRTHDEAVLTWPEGNGWLARQLAVPLGERVHAGRTVLRIAPARHGVEVDALDHATGRLERWRAAQCVVALPLHVAVRVVEAPPPLLVQAPARTPHAAWLVANLRLDAPLRDRPGAAPSWDNVLHGSSALGYVDARHQALDPRPGPTVLTWYCALGAAPEARRALLQYPWTQWRDGIVDELSVPHPDLRERLLRMDITRYGHAMAVPAPQDDPVMAPAVVRHDRLAFAHADWSGYSVFEEAFTRGHLAGLALARTG